MRYRKGYRRSSNRIPGVIQNRNHRLFGARLPDIMNCALAFEHHDLQRRRLRARDHRKYQSEDQDNPAAHAAVTVFQLILPTNALKLRV